MTTTTRQLAVVHDRLVSDTFLVLCLENSRFPGFFFIIIQRMDCELFAGIPQLIRHASGGSAKKEDAPFIELGAVFCRLLNMLHAVHKTHNLVIDIKAGNIMLAPEQQVDNNKYNNNSHPLINMHTFAQRLRLIDFGLVKFYGNPMTGQHYENTGAGGMQGTPLYWSRHVHAGHTPSRRDDLEAMGLVLAELVIRLQAMADGTTAEYESTHQFDSYLPWANAGSDDGIATVKQAMLPDIKSAFYERMGCQATARAMHTFFEKTLALDFAQEPKYDEFMELVRGLQVANPDYAPGLAATGGTNGGHANDWTKQDSPVKKRAARKTTVAAAAAPKSGSRTTRRAKRDKEENDVDETVASKPTKASGKRKAASSKANIAVTNEKTTKKRKLNA